MAAHKSRKIVYRESFTLMALSSPIVITNFCVYAISFQCRFIAKQKTNLSKHGYFLSCKTIVASLYRIYIQTSASISISHWRYANCYLLPLLSFSPNSVFEQNRLSFSWFVYTVFPLPLFLQSAPYLNVGVCARNLRHSCRGQRVDSELGERERRERKRGEEQWKSRLLGNGGMHSKGG